jgi:cellulose synthase (UDP-forming)
MFLLNLMAFCAGAILWMNQPTLVDTITICLIWNSFNLFLVIGCLGVVWERKQLRAAHRYETREDVRVRVPATGESFAAGLRDLSLSGVGLELESAGEPEEALLILEAESGGRRYELPVRVLRSQVVNGRRRLGGYFDMGRPEVRREVIGFVYGDSRRWKYFSDSRLIRGVGSFRAFSRLVRVGLKGSWRHAAGMAHLAAQRRRAAGAR